MAFRGPLLRATQFHGFVSAMLRKLAAPPVMLVPSGKAQTVSVDEVATALADAAGAVPAGRLPDFAGPEVLDLAQLARLWLGAGRKRRVVAAVPAPGTFGRLLRQGPLCNPARAVGKQTFADLARRERALSRPSAVRMVLRDPDAHQAGDQVASGDLTGHRLGHDQRPRARVRGVEVCPSQ